MMEFRLSASMISCLICLRQINIDFHNTNFRLIMYYDNEYNHANGEDL